MFELHSSLYIVHVAHFSVEPYTKYHQMHADVVQELHRLCHLFVHSCFPAGKPLHTSAMERLQTGEEKQRLYNADWFSLKLSD